MARKDELIKKAMSYMTEARDYLEMALSSDTGDQVPQPDPPELSRPVTSGHPSPQVLNKPENIHETLPSSKDIDRFTAKKLMEGIAKKMAHQDGKNDRREADYGAYVRIITSFRKSNGQIYGSTKSCFSKIWDKAGTGDYPKTEEELDEKFLRYYREVRDDYLKKYLEGGMTLYDITEDRRRKLHDKGQEGTGSGIAEPVSFGDLPF